MRVARAVNTLIMAMVMTNTGRLNTDASDALINESTTHTAMHTASIRIRLPVALYTVAPTAAETSILAPRDRSKEPIAKIKDAPVAKKPMIMARLITTMRLVSIS